MIDIIELWTLLGIVGLAILVITQGNEIKNINERMSRLVKLVARIGSQLECKLQEPENLNLKTPK